MVAARRIFGRAMVLSLTAAAACGCSNMNNTQKGAGLGAAGGAGLGAIIGHQFGSTGAGAAIGALAGTATGALVGNAKDEADKRDNYARQAAYERNLRHREQRAMTNRDVVDMVNSQCGDRLIISTIKNRGGNFDTTPHGIITLKQYGVSDQVIETMQATGY